MPLFPDVPALPGVPPLLRDPNALVGTAIAFLTRDTIGILPGLFAPQWGIFLDGDAVIDADSTLSVEYRQDWTISDFPQEQGAFQSYDKVNTPFDVRLVFAAGGSEANRQAFLQSVASIAGDLNLYDVVTPEQVYSSCNVKHYDYRRTSVNGVGLLQVAIYLEQVRVSASAAFSNTQAADSADPVSVGTVQPQAPTTQQSALSSLFN